jgi:hypothetical protein
VTAPEPDDPLERVRSAATALGLAEQALADSVHRAHAAGHSWAAIGSVLGTSRQAAFKRFGAVRDPATGRPVARTVLSGVAATTERVFGLLEAGRYDELRALMPDDVARVLTRDVLLGAWTRAIADTGHLVRCEDTVVELAGGEPVVGSDVLGTAVGVTTLVCEAGEWQGRVAIGSGHRLLGVLVVAPGSSGLPF